MYTAVPTQPVNQSYSKLRYREHAARDETLQLRGHNPLTGASVLCTTPIGSAISRKAVINFSILHLHEILVQLFIRMRQPFRIRLKRTYAKPVILLK